MPGIKSIPKHYANRALISALVLGLACVAAGREAAGRGLMLGSLFSALNFALMSVSLATRLAGGSRRRFVWALASIQVRYLLLAVPLILAVKLPQFDLAATVAGVFMVQLCILVEHIGRRLGYGRTSSPPR
jgi:hypothetical protein